MKKTVKKLTAIILAVMIALTCSMSGFAGDPGWIEEITAAEADEKYNSGEKCIIFFYQDGCYNCYNIETNVISYWLEYGTIVYAVNLPMEGWPVFLNKEYYGQTITTPIVAFVNGACTSYYMGATSFDVLNNAFYNFYGITPPVNITGVTLSKTSANLEIGDTLQLSATVSPSTANQSVAWSSSNTSVATVSSSGYVTAKASGSAYITATTADGSYSASCYVSVSECEASLESISIRTNPNKTTYTVGESFNSAGLTLNLHYSDGSTQVATNGFTCSKPDMSTAGQKMITVSYKCYMTSFTITVNAKPAVTLSSISIRTNPSKTTYTVGESFNSAGLTLNVYYSDGTSKSVTSGFTCSNPDMSTAGTKKVTVTYKGKTASFNITVKAKPVTVTLSSISVKTYPSKTVYNIGESFNSSGLTLNAKYSDGTTKTITSGFTCSKPDMTTAGIKTVTVTYHGKTATFNITVKAATVKATSVDIVVIEDFNGTNTAKVGAQVNPSNASYKSLVWSSSDPDIASVAYDGTITTHSEGVAIITVTVTNHDGTTVSDTIEVTVNGGNDSSGGGILGMLLSILELIFLPFTLLFAILFG